MTRRLPNPAQHQLRHRPHRQQTKHDRTLDGVIGLVQYARDEGGRQPGEQPEQGEGREPGPSRGDELAPAPLGDAEPGEADDGPSAGAHRFRNQAQARDRQHRQVHLEHQHRGMRTVLGEEPGDERA